MSKPDLHFVVSAPRSGSTWLINALNQHPQVFGTEQRLFGNFCEMWPNNNGNLAPRITFDAYARAFSVHYSYTDSFDTRQEFTDDFIAEYIHFLSQYAHRQTGCSVIVDKITPYAGTASWVMEQLQKFVPNARVYKLVRDGRDVLTSGTFDWLLKDGKGTDRYEYFVEKQPGKELVRFFDDRTIEKWAKLWKESLQACNLFPPVATIRYEAMKHDMAMQLTVLFQSLGVDSRSELAEQSAASVTFENMSGRTAGNMDATAKQRKGISGDWENFMTRRDGELFHQLAGDVLISEGYEDSSDWIERLPTHLPYKNPQKTTEGAPPS